MIFLQTLTKFSRGSSSSLKQPLSLVNGLIHSEIREEIYLLLFELISRYEENRLVDEYQQNFMDFMRILTLG